jgi:hypothetical protein
LDWINALSMSVIVNPLMVASSARIMSVTPTGLCSD